MEGPPRPSINHHLHEEVEEPQRQNANHLRLCLPRNVQGSVMPHTENDPHHGQTRKLGNIYPFFRVVPCGSVVEPYPQKSVSQREILPTTDDHGFARKHRIYILSSV